jgi:arsenate reductase (thioredoxin)
MKKLLFVCVENSCRSQIAEAFARIHGGDEIQAFSAGSRPSGTVNPKAIETMNEIGYDLSRHESKSLDDIPQETCDFFATMGRCDKCPFVRATSREDWKIPDPKNLPPDGFRRIRNEIEQKVIGLLSSLA